MFTKIDNTPENILGIEMSGKITKKDYKQLNTVMDFYKENHNHIKFLMVIKEFKWTSAAAMWEDFKMGLKYFKYIKKVAIVTELGWMEKTTKAADLVTPKMAVRAFHLEDKDKAMEWLASDDTTVVKKSTTRKRAPEIVVITGASAGVGRTTAWRFAEDGAHILLIARGQEALEATKKEVEERGGKAWVYVADVSDAQKMREAATFAEENLGPIDIWINNAMVSVFSPVAEMEPEEYKRVTEVTYLGQVYGTMAALEKMRERNRGKIILVGSALAFRGIPLQSAYCASKHAIQGFFESLRSELLHDGLNIGLSIVHLPAMNTTQFGWVKSRMDKKPKPMGTIFEPEVASQAIFETAHEDIRERMVAFSTVKTVWGNRLAPEFLDHYMAQHGFEGQLTDEPEDSERINNLWNPVPGDHGAHGTFANQSLNTSVFDSINEHKKPLAVGLVIAGLIVGGVLWHGRSSSAPALTSG